MELKHAVGKQRLSTAVLSKHSAFILEKYNIKDSVEKVAKVMQIPVFHPK